MTRSSLTIRLEPELRRELDRLCRQLGHSRSRVVRAALRRHITTLRSQPKRRQDAEDLAAFAARRIEPDIAFAKVVKKLRQSPGGRIAEAVLRASSRD